MEKIFLAIVVINILASLFLKKKRKPSTQHPKTKAKVDDREVHIKRDEGREPKKEIKKEIPTPVKKGLDTGKDLLREMAKEFGLEIPESKPKPQTAPSQPVDDDPWEVESIEEPSPVTFGSDNYPGEMVEPDEEKDEEFQEYEEPEPIKEIVFDNWNSPEKKYRSSSNVIGIKKTKPHSVLQNLKDINRFQEAFILKTVLEPPLALQKNRNRR